MKVQIVDSSFFTYLYGSQRVTGAASLISVPFNKLQIEDAESKINCIPTRNVRSYALLLLAETASFDKFT